MSISYITSYRFVVPQTDAFLHYSVMDLLPLHFLSPTVHIERVKLYSKAVWKVKSNIYL